MSVAIRLENKNYYELLGVDRAASKEDIKRAYRDLTRIFHPDSNFYSDIIKDPITVRHIEIFEKLSVAYDTLSSDEARARYDATLLNGTLKEWDNEPSGNESKATDTQKPIRTDNLKQGFGAMARDTYDESAFEGLFTSPAEHTLKRWRFAQRFLKLFHLR